jgi:hypothetical protein
MLKKFDLVHWLLIASGALTILGPDVAKLLDLFQLSAASATWTKVVSMLLFVIALVKQYAVPAAQGESK